MITLEQALTESRFHFGTCSVGYGKTGKAQPKVTMEAWRRNGATQTWVTRPGEFSIPVKFGLRSYAYITQDDAAVVHLEQDCPALAEEARWWAADEAGAFTGKL